MKEIKEFILERVKDYTTYFTNKYEDKIKSAIYDYVAGYTTLVNNELRKKRVPRNSKQITDLLDVAFDEGSTFVTNEKIDVYRTVDWAYFKNIYGITKENIDEFIGKTVVNKAYMSTAGEMVNPWHSNKWWEDELLMHIVSKRPYPCIDINSVFTADEIDCEDQKEKLLPRNTKMEIKNYSILKGKRFEGGTYLIEMEIKS